MLGSSVFHICPQHVVSQFHTDFMLLPFSLVTRFHSALQIATDEWLPLLHEFVAIRAASPARARVQNSQVRAFYSREIALASLYVDQ